MHTIQTLGHPSKRTTFAYSGNVADGITIEFKNGTAKVSVAFIDALLVRFRGQTIPGGFNMTSPTPGGLGEWVRDNSEAINIEKLSPRHASFIAAVLAKEMKVQSMLNGNAVYLIFIS